MQLCRKIHRNAFTLIELSIVLVIIGLITGGILAGRDLIKSARLRAQVTQIEQLMTAVNTFKGKYNGYLPGDIPSPYATQFGFIARGSYAGQGDGNGFIEGLDVLSAGQNDGRWQTCENLVFWRDLSTAQLIPGKFTRANFALLTPNGAGGGGITATSSPGLSEYIPSAKLDNIFYIHTTSNGSLNYFVLSAVIYIELGYTLNANESIPVIDAYSIDKKVDDGFATRGNVTSSFLSNGYFGVVAADHGNPDTAATCFNSVTNAYSINVDSGANPNCGLTFKMR